MVMFTLAKAADTLKLNSQYSICIIYLGFGAGAGCVYVYRFCKKEFRWKLRRRRLLTDAVLCRYISRFLKCNFGNQHYFTAILELLGVRMTTFCLHDFLISKRYHCHSMAVQLFQKAALDMYRWDPLDGKSIMIDIIPIIIMCISCMPEIYYRRRGGSQTVRADHF